MLKNSSLVQMLIDPQNSKKEELNSMKLKLSFANKLNKGRKSLLQHETPERKVIMSKMCSPKMTIQPPEHLSHTTDLNDLSLHSQSTKFGDRISNNFYSAKTTKARSIINYSKLCIYYPYRPVVNPKCYNRSPSLQSPQPLV